MNVDSSCTSRLIRKVNASTPLLIPSFSSTISDDIGRIHENLGNYITTVSLISAYDLFYGYIDKEAVWLSELVFLDSGNYEKEYFAKIESKKLKDWSYDKYLDIINKLEPITKFVLINYDKASPLEEQISDAEELFSNFPNYATCFLCKPTPNSWNQIDISTLIEHIGSIEQFGILGFAEKELGKSLLDRCGNISNIRGALKSKGIEIPLHIFGCLDPLSIIPYFVCGADIFDGLSWLRYSFHNYTAIYVNNYAILRGRWSETDSRVNALSYILNLNELTHLEKLLRNFSETYDLKTLGLSEEISAQIKALSCAAGIVFR